MCRTAAMNKNKKKIKENVRNGIEIDCLKDYEVPEIDRLKDNEAPEIDCL